MDVSDIEELTTDMMSLWQVSVENSMGNEVLNEEKEMNIIKCLEQLK